MQLEFPYIKGRPMLTAKLGKNRDEARYLDFLIDSGSDYTIIPKSDGEILGINYEEIKGKEIRMEAANLTGIHGKETKMNIDIRGHNFTIPVVITEEEGDRLLGRIGVFNKFNIIFKEREGKVVFEEI